MAIDLMALVARLGLDSSAYEDGLARARQDFMAFSEGTREGLSTAERVTGAAVAAVGAAAARVAQAQGEFESRGAELSRALAAGVYSGEGAVSGAASALGSAAESALRGPAASAAFWGRDLVEGFIAGISQRAQALRAAVSNVAETVRRYLHFSEPDEGPLSDFHTYAPDMMALFARGIRDNAHLVTEQVGASFDLAPQIAQAAMPAGRGESRPAGEAGAGDRPVNIVFELEGVQQWVYRLNRLEEQRVGLRLAQGGE